MPEESNSQREEISQLVSRMFRKQLGFETPENADWSKIFTRDKFSVVDDSQPKPKKSDER